jgi:hypothetical protein
MDSKRESARQRVRDALADLRQTNKWAAACAIRMRSSQNTATYQHWCGEAIVANAELAEAALVYHDAVATYLTMTDVPT